MNLRAGDRTECRALAFLTADQFDPRRIGFLSPTRGEPFTAKPASNTIGYITKSPHPQNNGG